MTAEAVKMAVEAEAIKVAMNLQKAVMEVVAEAGNAMTEKVEMPSPPV